MRYRASDLSTLLVSLAAGAWLRLKQVVPGLAAELLQRATRRFTDKSDAADRPSLLERLSEPQ